MDAFSSFISVYLIQITDSLFLTRDVGENARKSFKSPVICNKQCFQPIRARVLCRFFYNSVKKYNFVFIIDWLAASLFLSEGRRTSATSGAKRSCAGGGLLLPSTNQCPLSKTYHVIGFFDLVDLWVTKVKEKSYDPLLSKRRSRRENMRKICSFYSQNNNA